MMPDPEQQSLIFPSPSQWREGRGVGPSARIPRATYRLQLHAGFTFRDALALVPYLHALGISDCYLSPILLARPGSMHGYDVCDPTQLNPELGSEADFAALSDALQACGIGLLVDTVPNHMGIDCDCNAWWTDVLENGPSSLYASYFDIDWQPVKAEIANKVLLPILGDQYGQALESGALHLVFDNGAFFLVVYDQQRLPIAPRTYQIILSHRLDALKETLGAAHSDVMELESIITALAHLPLPTETDPERVTERYREKEVAKRRIAALYAASEDFQSMLDATMSDFNGKPDDPASFDLLDDLISQQSYRPAHWLVASEEINYRRFFDVNALGAVMIERPAVFEATHQVIFRLLASGQVTGLRIDHPDGLWDPAQYFRQLQERFLSDHLTTQLQAQQPGAAPEELAQQVSAMLAAWREAQEATPPAERQWPLYIVVEKILSEREPLPTDWAVFGTTGYDFLNGVNDIFVAREHVAAMTRIYQDFTDNCQPYSDYSPCVERRGF